MKRIVFAVTVALMTISLSAQDFGIRGGLNAASEQRGNDVNNTSSIMAPRLGVFVRQPLGGHVFIRPELMLNGKGYAYEETILGTSVNSYARPNYMEVPLFIGVQSGTDPLNLYFEGGPFIAAAVGGRYQTDAGPFEDSGMLEFGEGEDDDYSGSDYGISLGAGIDVISTFEVGLNYDIGLKDVRPANQNGDAIYTRAFGFYLGLMF